MAIKLRAALKALFSAGKKPSAQDFADLVDSVVHVQESDVNGPGEGIPYYSGGYRNISPEGLNYSASSGAFAAGYNVTASGDNGPSAFGTGTAATHDSSQAGGMLSRTRRAAERVWGGGCISEPGDAQNVELALVVSELTDNRAVLQLAPFETLVAHCTYADVTGAGCTFTLMATSNSAGDVEIQVRNKELMNGWKALHEFTVYSPDDFLIVFAPEREDSTNAVGNISVVGSSVLQ